MKSLFFDHESFDREIKKKLLSRKANPDELFAGLTEKLIQRSISREVLDKIQALYRERLSNAPFQKEDPTYLSHPIRVAASVLPFLDKIRYEDLMLALCHNLKERMGEGFDETGETWLPAGVRKNIEILTIDRSQEGDPAYLNEFYAGVERAGLMLFKALDKLDNAFCWVLIERLQPYHAEIVLQWVCPRIAVPYPRLEKYLRELIPYVLEEKTKDPYRLLKQAKR